MKSYYLACPFCGALDHEPLFPSFWTDRQVTPMQTVGICRQCGMVYRNPYIPSQCPALYQDVSAWGGGTNPVFLQRAASLAREITSRVQLGAGELFMDIGTGAALLPAELESAFPSAQAVLLDPAPNVATWVKAQHPRAVVLLGRIDEVVLPRGAFSLITACAVDYLFHDHRADIEKIADALRAGGVFYVERFSLDERSFWQQPILDPEDLFGLNPGVNTWFGREQFTEYLSEFFDVFDEITYTYDVTPPPHSRPTSLTGVFCRKRSAVSGRSSANRPNRYEQHLAALRARAPESSLEDLRQLARTGIRTVAACGRGPEAAELADLIKRNNLFELAGLVESVETELPKVDAFLIASIGDEQRYLDVLEARGYHDVTFPCFRRGQSRFWSDGSTRIQMKAFLPAFLRSIPTRQPIEISPYSFGRRFSLPFGSVIKHNAADVRGSGPVSVVTPAEQWAYAAEFAFDEVAADVLDGIVRFDLDVHVVEGVLGIGCLGSDGLFLTEVQTRSVGAPERVTLRLESGEMCRSIMVRNASPQLRSSRADILKITATTR